ncbi:MAG: ABC transporter permease [Lachnospiraceae bacterium]|jgi:peptide/nickel transport system permease protein
MKNGKEFLHAFVRHKLAMVGLIVFLAEVVAVLLLPPLMHLDPTAIDSTHFSSAPSAEHLLGTDDVGRDMFARVVCGGRVSILIGIAATAISVAIGLPLGLLAGFYRGKTETIIMRAADIFLSFPSMVLILVVVAVFGSSIPSLIILIGVLNWPTIAKLIYGNVLSVRSMEYVEAERAIGTPSLRILIKTVMPNSIAPLWVSLSFRISNAMITESALSFLGAGVQPPTPSWGNIIQSATSLVVLTQRWWIWIPAGVCLVVTIFCINFIGEGIRDALDPKMKRF